MNDFELQKELDHNFSDKQLINAELEASKKKWAEYILKNKEEICSSHHPIVVKKKKRALFNEFILKIKAIFGLEPRKEKIDGIEAYLRDSYDYK